MKWELAIVAMLVLSGAGIFAAQAADEMHRCPVLIDFGNGRVLWADVPVSEGMNVFNLTQEAADRLHIEVDYMESPYGVFVNGFDGILGNWPYEWWHLWIWNSTLNSWQLSTMGAADLHASDVEAVAWSYVMDRPDYSCVSPIATPNNRYPWTSFRHDLMNTGYSDGISLEKSRIVWDLNLSNGGISSSIVTCDDRIFVVTAGIYDWTSFEYTSAPKVTCIDFSGNILWQADIDAAGYQIATPVVAGSLIVVPSTDGKIYALNRHNGSLEWSAQIANPIAGITSSPIFYRNQIIVGGGDGKIYAFAENGSLLWDNKIASSIYFSSPSAQNGTIYIGSEDGRLHAISSDGSGELWNITIGGRIRSAPLLTDEMIIVTYAIYENYVPIDGGVAAVFYNGTLRWNIDINATSSSPALTSSGIVVTSSDGVTMISRNGEVIWKRDLGASLKGSPSIGRNTIYVVSYNTSEVYALNEEGNVMWHETLRPSQYSMCSPTITDNMVFVASDNGHVYALSVPTERSGDQGLILPVAALLVAIAAIVTLVVIKRRK
ncbi:MAG: PQQ-binding-like beta-propeller repeat protein [Methanomassiliicoccales archaeon]|jgi:outer membrane protein assembly factor BamB|nr:PQQ-binding-like beta-propeller repeat protein [Methanomassiliicoccales archaeon]